MNSLRAQLKVEVYKIVEAQNQNTKDKNGFKWEHPLLKQIKGMAEGIITLEIILEYLEFFKLDYTAQVLRKEANLNDPIIRDKLAGKIGLGNNKDSLRPLLMIMVTDMKLDDNRQIKSPTKPQVNREDEFKKEEAKKKEEAAKKQKEEEEQKKAKAKEKDKPKPKETPKEQARAQSAPAKVEPPATVVNKIRGTTAKGGLSMFGLDIGEQQAQIDPIFGGGNANKTSKAQGIPKNVPIDPYDFDFDAPVTVKDPYAFDMDVKKPDLSKTIGGKNKFNAHDFDGKKSKYEEVEEDIDWQESRDDRVKQSNNMFTSDEDYMKATQSLGVDESVDSMALEDYDYYEDVHRKKK